MTNLFSEKKNIAFPTLFEPSEDSDQPAHPRSLIRVFAVRLKMFWIFGPLTECPMKTDQTARKRRLI